MARVVFPLHENDPVESRNATAAPLVTALARLLKANGDDVTVIVVRKETDRFVSNSDEHYRALGIEVLTVEEADGPNRWSEIWPMQLSEKVSPMVRGFDIVYFVDCGDLAIHTVRAKRFATEVMPVCVTVLDRPLSWILASDRKYPVIPADLNLEFVERYSARHSDFVIATTGEVLHHAETSGWKFGHDPEVLELPAAKDQWLAFHDRVCGLAARQTPRLAPPTGLAVHPAVDICVTYYNKARHFPQLLLSLEHQTSRDFNVIAVDDGSPDPEARAVFDGMAEKYAPKGWIFFRQPNSYVDAARNRAAERSVAEYLLMIDADDAFPRNAVERLLEAARFSGDDCLVSASWLFASDEFPYDLETGKLTAPPFAHYMPVGANVVAGMIDPRVFGGPAILIRRRVFEAIGGYREIRGSAHEDWELHARLALAGYKTDVVPEYLHFYRQVEDGLARTADDFLAKRRILETYDQHLASVGMYGAATAMHALYRQWRELDKRAELYTEMTSGRFNFLSSMTRLETFAADNEGPPVIRALRRLYRRNLSLETRLRFYYRIMKLLGRNR